MPGTSGTSSRLPMNAEPEPSAETGSNDLRRLTVHRKKSKTTLKSLEEDVKELFATTGRKSREDIVKVLFALSEEGFTSKAINDIIDGFQIEEDIENNDPVSIDDALSRVRNDIDSLVRNMTPQDMKNHFFSPASDREVKARSRLEHIECQWMNRWINPSEGTKRGFEEWAQVIGFAGEYMVSFHFFAVVTVGLSSLPSACSGLQYRAKLDK
jgi:hypothetical protein